MSNQMQCPNCGGYKVSVQNKNVIATEKQKQPATFMQTMAGWLFIGFYVFLFIVGIVAKWGIGQIVGIGFIVLLIGFAMYRAVKTGGMSQTVTVPTLVKYDFKCEICGYNWTWRTDQPLPKVQVNPDLIAKGAQKLEEEAEAERRKQQEAAALYYLTHKK